MLSGNTGAGGRRGRVRANREPERRSVPGIVLPELGYATREGTVLRWLKATGEPVAAGEELVEVAMEKTVHVLVASQDGALLAVYAPE
ncbi:MAG: hypothetical protein GWO16_03465, partial [Gammaproteobacteria bacterium]|nr:hypothetical protein [Gammaproteobacteria bacterium]